MTEESRIREETISEVLHALFEEGEEKGYWSPRELAQRVRVKPEELLDALTNPFLTEPIHRRMAASLWAALPAIFKALIEGAQKGSLPHARYLLGLAGIGGEGLSEPCAFDGLDESARLNREELVDYVERGIAFARKSHP